MTWHMHAPRTYLIIIITTNIYIYILCAEQPNVIESNETTCAVCLQAIFFLYYVRFSLYFISNPKFYLGIYCYYVRVLENTQILMKNTNKCQALKLEEIFWSSRRVSLFTTTKKNEKKQCVCPVYWYVYVNDSHARKSNTIDDRYLSSKIRFLLNDWKKVRFAFFSHVT